MFLYKTYRDTILSRLGLSTEDYTDFAVEAAVGL